MKQIFSILVFFLTVGINCCYSQLIRTEIQEIATSIATENVLTGNSIGYSEEKPKQWKRFETLKAQSTNDELKLLTNNQNAVVRCYAFQALAQRNGIDLFPIVLNHLNDTATITTYIGCDISSHQVGDYFLERVTTGNWDSDSYKLNEKERAIVDSVLIFDKTIQLLAKSEILVKIKPDLKYYSRIREIVQFEKNVNGLIALSKYNKPQDKSFIIQKLKSKKDNDQYFGLWAVRYFPDLDFFRYVNKIHYNTLKKNNRGNFTLIRMLYQAIVQYKDINSRNLIELTLHEANDYTFHTHSELIWLALEKYPDKIYEGLLDKVNLSESEMNRLNYWLENPDR